MRASRQHPEPRLDPLGPVLEGVRLRCLMPSAHELTAPWGIELGAISRRGMQQLQDTMGLPVVGPLPSSHGHIVAVLHGSCCLEVPKHRFRAQLVAGELTIVDGNTPFIIRDEWERPVRHISELVNKENAARGVGLQHGGGGAPSTILTGPYYFEDTDDDHPLVAGLPPVLYASREAVREEPWVASTLQVINGELRTRHAGFQTIVNHLMYSLFVQALRVHAASASDESTANWFRAIFDVKLAPTLQAIHTRPEHPWTVASLAKLSGMSRSVFSRRFSSMMGTSPLHYVSNYRMARAKTLLLREPRLSLKVIAEKVGYNSESAFCQAFKRRYEVPPARLRKPTPAIESGRPACPPSVSAPSETDNDVSSD